MNSLRLRVLKRHTSLEVPFEEFFKAELYNRNGQPDVNLSVFDIEIDSLVRTHAEYVVSFLDPSSKKRGGLSLNACNGDFDPTPSPADRVLFTYSRTRHIELRFLRESELRAWAEQLHREVSDRQQSASAREVIEYGRERLGAEDEEWVQACEAKPKWKREFAP